MSEIRHFLSFPLGQKETVDFCQTIEGKVALVVNTASRCAFTDQYAGLEQLFQEYGHRGLLVVGFPSNDFANQEPGTAEQIKTFCRVTYGVQFPMFSKTQVRGGAASPLYRQLGKLGGEAPGWNFHKYLIDREGRVVGSFASRVEPRSDELVSRIERLL